MEKICDICRKEKRTRYFARRNKNICADCYDKYFSIKYKCDICHEYNFIKSRKNNLVICHKCYRALNKHQDTGKRPLRLCYKCGNKREATQKTKNGYVCYKCYEPPKKECSKCGKLRIVKKYINKKPLCIYCYKSPKKKCSLCGRLDYIKKRDGKKLICQKCYKYPQIKCFQCGRTDRAYKLIDKKPICRRCYDKERLGIEKYRLMGVLRKRLRDAFRYYSINGKVSKSVEYGIDYEAIIEHLGSCPGNREDYHIDHIFPLSAFNFDEEEQIKLAFAPENHQWLKKEDNLVKSNYYNKDDFKKYIAKIYQ